MAFTEEELQRLDQHWSDQEKTSANASVLKSQGMTPQQYNADKLMSEESQVPMSMVPDVREDITRDQDIQKVQSLKATAPSTFKQIGDSEHAWPQMQDDLDNVANFETVLTEFSNGNLTRGRWSGIMKSSAQKEVTELGESYQQGRDLHEMALLWNEKSLRNELNPAKQARLDHLVEASKHVPPNKWGVDPFDSAAEVIGQMQDGMLAGLDRGAKTGVLVGAAAAFGGPFTSAAAFVPGFSIGFSTAVAQDAFRVEQGLSYQETMEATNNHDLAVNTSVVVGILNAGLEVAGLKFVSAPVKKAVNKMLTQGVTQTLKQTNMKNLLKGTATVYGTAIAGETGTEMLQEIINFAGTEIAKSIDPEIHKKGTIGELTDRVMEVGWKVAQAMAVLGMPGAGVHYVSGRGQVAQSEHSAELFERVREASENIDTLDTAPDEIKSIIRDIVEKGDVDGIYVEADRFMQYFQSVGIDPLAEENKAIFESLGVADQLEEASSRNGDIVIPLDNYIKDIVRTEHHSGLSPDLRFHSGDWSATESKTWQENNPELIQDLQTEYDAMLSQFEETQKGDELFESIYQQLVNTGMDVSSAAKSASLHRAFAKTMEARFGIRPEQTLSARGVNIQRVMPGPPIEKTPAAIRILAEQLTSPAPIKTESQLKGSSLMSFLASKGGLQDVGGELAARNAELWHQGKPGQAKFVKDTGMTLGAAALIAREQGYLLGLADDEVFGASDSVGQTALLEAIDKELAGDPVFAEQNIDREAIDLLDQREQLVDFLAQKGIHVDQASRQEVEQALAEAVFSDQADLADDAYLQTTSPKPADYDQLSGDDKVAIDEFIDRMDDPEAVRQRLREHAGTPWARQAMDGAKTRMAMEMLLRGEEPGFISTLTAPSATNLYNAIKQHGEEGAWNYLMATGLIGHPSKPENAVNSSFLNCIPSKNCAAFCYAAKGRNYPANVNKAELVTWAVERDPVRAAKMVASSYKAMAEYEANKALRLFDKGDGDMKWLPFIAELNRQKVRAHVFTKNVEFLRAIPDYNLRLLSIDRSNLEMAEANKDLPVAFVYEGEQDVAWLNAHQDQVQVILPVKQGANYLPESDLKALPKWARKYTCPIDDGRVSIDNWNCTRCDKAGGVGCYHAQTTAQADITQQSLATAMAQDDFPLTLKEVLNAVSGLDINQQEIVFEKLALQLSAARADVDEGAEGIVDQGTQSPDDSDGSSGEEILKFDTSSVFRHDRGYRYPNPDEGPITEILDGPENTAFDGIFAENIGEYHPGMELSDNDFIVKHHADHTDFNRAVDDNPAVITRVLEHELPSSSELSDDQITILNDFIRESDSVEDSWVTNEGPEVPFWGVKLFGTDDSGEISWEVQRLRGRVARELGFDAIDMKDEQGVSTLILSGGDYLNLSSGKYDSSDDKTFFQSETTTQAQRNGIGLYSHIELGVLALNKKEWRDGAAASGKQILQWINKIQGVKGSELEALGLEDFLSRTVDGKPVRLTRDDVAAYIRSNGLIMKLSTAVTDMVGVHKKMLEAYGLDWGMAVDVPATDPAIQEMIYADVDYDMNIFMERVHIGASMGVLGQASNSKHIRQFISDWILKRSSGTATLADNQALGRMVRNAYSPESSVPSLGLQSTTPGEFTSPAVDWVGLADEDVIRFVLGNNHGRMLLAEKVGMPDALLEAANKDLPRRDMGVDHLFKSMVGFSEDQATEFIDMIYDDIKAEFHQVAIEAYQSTPHRVWSDASKQVKHQIKRVGDNSNNFYLIYNNAGIAMDEVFDSLRDAQLGVIKDAIEFGQLEDKGDFNPGTFWAQYATADEVMGVASNYREIKIVLPQFSPDFRATAHNFKEINILFFMRVWDRIIDTGEIETQIKDLPKEVPGDFKSIYTEDGDRTRLRSVDDINLKIGELFVRREGNSEVLARLIAEKPDLNAQLMFQRDKYKAITGEREALSKQKTQEYLKTYREKRDSLSVDELARWVESPEAVEIMPSVDQYKEWSQKQVTIKQVIDRIAQKIERNNDEVKAREEAHAGFQKRQPELEQALKDFQLEYEGTRPIPDYYFDGKIDERYGDLKQKLASKRRRLIGHQTARDRITNEAMDLVDVNRDLIMSINLSGIDLNDEFTFKRNALIEYSEMEGSRRNMLEKVLAGTMAVDQKSMSGITLVTQQEVDIYEAVKEFANSPDAQAFYTELKAHLKVANAEDARANSMAGRIKSDEKDLMDTEKSWAERMAAHKKPIYKKGKAYNLDEFQSDWHTAGKKQGYQPEGFTEAGAQEQIKQASFASHHAAKAWRAALDDQGQLSVDSPVFRALQKQLDLSLSRDVTPGLQLDDDSRFHDLVQSINPGVAYAKNVAEIFNTALQAEAGWDVAFNRKLNLQGLVMDQTVGLGEFVGAAIDKMMTILQFEIDEDRFVSAFQEIARDGPFESKAVELVEMWTINDYVTDHASVTLEISHIEAIKLWAQTVKPGWDDKGKFHGVYDTAMVSVDVPLSDMIALLKGPLRGDAHIETIFKQLAQKRLSQRAIADADNQIANIPFKDDAWVTLAAKRAIIDAIEGGYDYVTWPDANTLVDRWSESGRGLYTMLYDEKMPGAVKKLLTSKIDHISSDVGSENFYDSTEPQGYYRVKITDQDREKHQHGMPIYQGKSDAHQGSIQFKEDETVISLFESSNLSTFLHESGHFFLESLGEMAEADNAHPELMQEYGAILNFLGVESRQGITRDHHEKFARAFEAYLFEGKSPSVELQSAFQSFKSWLLDIYKKIMNLDVELNDEIRQVFDRMLATDEEISAAEEVNNYQPAFTTPEQAGMSQEAFNTYIQSADKYRQAATDELERVKLKDIRRQKETEWKDNKKIVHARIEKEINQLKVFQATYFLTHGDALDGTLPPGLTAMKLDRDALIQMNGGAEVLRLLPGRGRFLTYARQGGVHPDAIATLFGYETGQDMIDDIIETHQPRDGETKLYSRKQRIQDVTEQEMRKQFGDVYMDGRVEELAKDALHNDQRGNFLATELRALSRRVGQPGTPANIARAIAQKTIGDLKTSQIRPGSYHLAEVRSAKAAERAILLEDWAEASIQKRHQLVNHYLFREARDAQAEVDKIVDRLKRFDRPGTRRNISRGFLEQIDKLLERFDLKRSVSLKALERRQAFGEWVAERQAEGQEVIITPQLQALLEVAGKTHYKSMRLDDLRALDDTIKNIAHLARLKQKLINNHEKRQYESVIADMVGFAQDNHTWKEHPVDYMESKIKKFMQGSAEFLAEHRKLEFVFRRMDAEQIDGPFWHYLFKPIADAENLESEMQEVSVLKLKEIFDIYTRKERLAFGNKIKTNLGNMPKQKILAIALNWGNEGNREAVMRGENWMPSQVDQMFDAHMTEKDWQFVQAAWDHIDSFWPQIAELEFQLTGVRPKKVDRATIQTRFGEIEGGYYPLKSDPTRNERSFKHAEAEATKDLFETNWLRPATKHGHTIERQGFGGQPVLLDISVISQHINNVIHDLSHRTAIIQVDRLTQDKRVQEAIIAVTGRATYRQIRPWLQGIASDLAPLDSQLEKAVGHFRQGATIVYMGWKMTTGMVQPLGYLQTIDMIGEKYAMKGLASFYNPVRLKEKLAFVMENSIAMRNRQKTFDRDVRDTLKRLTGDTLEARMAKTYFFHIGFLDMAVAMPSWLGAYEKAMQAEGLNHEAAVAYADSVVRTSQAGGGVKDLAKIQRGGELKRMFIMFYSYFSALYNLIERRAVMTKTGVSGPGKAITSLMYLVVLPALLGELIVGRGPDEDDEDEEKAAWAAKTIMAYPFMSVVGVRDVAQAIAGDFGYGMSPVPQAVEQSIQGFTAIDDLFDEDEEFTKWDLKNMSMWGGYMFHLPVSQLWISGEELYDTFEEGNDFSMWEFLVRRDPDE